MNAIKIDMTHPLHLMLAIEFIANLNRVVQLKAVNTSGSFTTFFINVDHKTINEMKSYILENS